MEIFFQENEISLLERTFNLNLSVLFNKISLAEEIYHMEEYSDEVLTIVNESSIKQSCNLILKTVFFRSKELNTYGEYLNSFSYYFHEHNREYNLLTRSGGVNFNKYKNALLNLECSLINFMNSLVEAKLDIRNKKCVTIFECCQAERNPLDLMNEVKIIRDNLLTSMYYFPIVRFSVNRNILKKTIKMYFPEVLHFVCHGEDNGDLIFFNGDKSGLKNISPEYFEKVIQIYKNKKIDFIYLNSCFSKKFLLKIKSNNCKFYFTYGLGYDGENVSCYAKEFAENFYNDLSHNGNQIDVTYKNTFTSFPNYKVVVNKKEIKYKDNLLFL